VHRSDIFLLMSVQGLGRVKTPGKRMHGYFGLVGRNFPRLTGLQLLFFGAVLEGVLTRPLRSVLRTKA
jgi:hypothetical protein